MSIITKPGSASLFNPKPVMKSRPSFLLFASKSRPSVSEIERAIGVAPDPLRKSPSDMNSSVMDFLESSPIGKEGAIEKAIREVAEKVTDKAEANTASGHRFVLNLCMMILPMWLLALGIVSGAIKLPFDAPFLDDLIM